MAIVADELLQPVVVQQWPAAVQRPAAAVWPVAVAPLGPPVPAKVWPVPSAENQGH